MAALLEGFKALGVGRLIAMAAVAGAMLLILAFLALRGGGSDHMALLYADMDLREAAQVADQLDKAHIAHEVGPDGTRISVPASDVRGPGCCWPRKACPPAAPSATRSSTAATA